MSATTLVIQSHREPLPFQWLQSCLESVSGWADSQGFEYRLLGDEIFELVDSDLCERLQQRPVVLSDLARLKALQQGLTEGFETVIWCDADFLISDPDSFMLPQEQYLLGREVWVQMNDNGKLKVYRKVHNAFLMFGRGNHFLDYYCASAESLIRRNQGNISPQFIGPKLLTALHNIVACPVFEQAGMLSPLVIEDLLNGGGNALDRFKLESGKFPAAVNLSSSLVESSGFDETQMEQLIERLKQRKC